MLSEQFQVEANEAASPEAQGSRMRTRLVWTGIGFAGLMLLALSAWTIPPLSSHGKALSVSAAPAAHLPKLAFNPSMPLELSSKRIGLQASRPVPGVFRTPERPRPASRRGNDFLKGMVASDDRPDWPEGLRPHRWMNNGDSDKEVNVNFITPTRYSGSRAEGVYKGSYHVSFTLPESRIIMVQRQNQTAADFETKPRLVEVEVLRSNEKDKPSFGAVAVKLPLDIATIGNDCSGKRFSGQARIVVSNVRQGNAKRADIRKGDIIRGVSVPEGSRALNTKAWFELPGKAGSKVEEGTEQRMAMFDNEGVWGYRELEFKFSEALRENGDGEVVLLIERPALFNLDTGDDDGFSWGKAEGMLDDLLEKIKSVGDGADKAPGAGKGPGAGAGWPFNAQQLAHPRL